MRGPNVMLGYLRAEHPGVLEPPDGGWHDTGDIVTIDPDGFITIKGRAKRFAKIGGEMVSLAAVEACAPPFGPTRGRRPRPCRTRARASASCSSRRRRPQGGSYVAFAKDRHMADIAMPSEVMVVESVPQLGTGKTDFMAVQALVRGRSGGATPLPENTTLSSEPELA